VEWFGIRLPISEPRLKRHRTLRVVGGRAVAQAVSRWLPTAAARIRVRAACGACGEQSGTGAGFLRVLPFPLPIIPPIPPSSYLPRAGTVGLLVAAVPSGPNWTPPPTIPIKKKGVVGSHAWFCIRDVGRGLVPQLGFLMIPMPPPPTHSNAGTVAVLHDTP
jgi:hypothetical protein